MDKEKNAIDTLFKTGLQDAEFVPSEAVWERISQSLDAQKSQKRYFWWLVSSAAAVVILFISLGVLFFSSSKTPTVPKPQKAKMIVPSADSSVLTSDSLRSEKIKTKSAVVLDLAENQVPAKVTAEQKKPGLSPLFASSIKERRKFKAIALRTELPERITLKQGAYPLKSMRFSPSSINRFKVEYAKKMAYLDKLLAVNVSQKKEKSWSLGLAFAPGFVEKNSGSLFSSSMVYDADPVTGLNLPATNEESLPVYSGGLNLVYRFSDRWSVESGLSYQRQGQQIQDFKLIQSTTNAYVETYYGEVEITNPLAFASNVAEVNYYDLSSNVSLSMYNESLVQQFELIEIPVLFNYKLIDRRWSLFLLAGINQGIVVGNKVWIKTAPETIVGKTTALNTFIYKSVLGFSLQYPVVDRFYLNVGPSFKYQLTNFNKQALTTEQLYYLEFKAGVSYRFK